MLRITIALQALFGAALGYGMARNTGLAATVLTMLVAAVATPFVGNTITIFWSFFKPGLTNRWHWG